MQCLRHPAISNPCTATPVLTLFWSTRRRALSRIGDRTTIRRGLSGLKTQQAIDFMGDFVYGLKFPERRDRDSDQGNLVRFVLERDGNLAEKAEGI